MIDKINKIKKKIKDKLSYSILKDEKIDYFNQPCPENKASLWSLLTFGWTQRMLMTGYFRGPIGMNDINDLPEDVKVQTTTPLLDNIDYNGSKWPLIKHIYTHFVTKNKKSIFIEITCAIFSILSPLCLKYFINYIQSDEEEKTFLVGLGFCVLLFVGTFSYTFSSQFLYWWGMRTSLHVRGALTQRIYEKMLRLSSSGGKKYNSGSIMNMISTDIGLFADFFWIAHLEIIIFPFQITALLALLCWIVGWSGLVGFGVMIISLPINTFFGSQMSKNLMLSLGFSDTRCNLTSEFINGIRFLKLYAWEKLFLDRIEEQRRLQLKYLYRRTIFSIFEKMLSQSTNAVVLVSTFAVYSIHNEITLSVAFTAITIFVNLRQPIMRLPEAIHNLLSLIPSAKRIESFFQLPEIQVQPFINYNNKTNNEDIIIDNGTFDWNQDENENENENEDHNITTTKKSKNQMKKRLIEKNEDDYNNDEDVNNDDNNINNYESYLLNKINFKAPAGKLTIICGVVGSGKSSLVNGLIGEIYRVNGKVNMPGKISFTTQQSFLISTSLRENILFGNTMDLERYKKVIEACCLTADLLQLSGKDLTEIGERGINLSGGQKQRISLARALYADSDCYILDEPLSAVDPEVATHLFNHCIQGMMKDKTRILVTHQLQFIPSADHIIVVDNGKLVQGTYQELKSNGIDFESIMKTKKLNIENQNNNDETNTNNNNEPILIEENEMKKSTSLIESSKLINIDEIISDRHDPNLIEKAKLLVKEDKSEGAIGLNVYKEYFSHGSSSFFFIATCIVYFFSQAIFQMTDFWLSAWSQHKIKDKSDSFYILYYVLFISIFIITLLIRYFMLAHVTFSASKNLHTSLLNAVGFAGCQFFDTNPSGRILNRFSKDIAEVDLLLYDLYSDVLYCGSTVIFAICVMIYISPLISIPFLLLVIVYNIIKSIYVASSRDMKRYESITRSPIFSLLQESYNGLITIRSYQQQKRFISMMQNHNNINLRLFYYSFSIHRWIGVRLELISALVVFLAAFFSLFNSNTGFSVLSVTTALSMCTYLNWAVRQFVELEVKMNSVERIKSYIHTPKEGNRYTIDFNHERDEEDDETMIKLDEKWPTKGEIEFKNVEIKYRPTADPSLKNLSFKINSNDHIGIVGRTGAGKSTVGISLFRMVECSKGSIFIDGIDISKIGLHELRSSLGIVPQDPFIFSGSIRLNIDPFNKYTDNEIWVALEKVKLKSTISSMPLKLETMIEEGGDGLSFGQKQLLCLSRTILKNSKVVLMDEATSGIDYVTSDLIKQTLLENFNDCTMLTIAHRLDTIIDSTKIAVVDKGELVEYDTPMNLINTKNSKFSKLVKYQTDFHKENEKNF
ncbi:hypothetical protein RB653_005654 [Dictyostelium firmibasis]|uniref:Uncharacterized protein n=1 Tax=Dictyostelium firmibasis TaxID=79012 RepID=A0AAN7Z1A6_9MYCE